MGDGLPLVLELRKLLVGLLPVLLKASAEGFVVECIVVVFFDFCREKFVLLVQWAQTSRIFFESQQRF
uniref:Putative secreted protein n=1 Tax=Ixodes ricinus TaxID=34613 RepID=A0A6B0U1J2_IXORI